MFIKKALFLSFLLTTCAIFVSPLSATTVWNESTNGELSSNGNAPSNVGALTAGDNLVIGALVNDQDDFTFFVPVGNTLTGIILTSQTSTGSPSPNLFLVKGTAFTGSPSLGSVNWLSGSVAVGDNLLTKVGSGPLASGNYEVVFTGFGATSISAYTFNLAVAPVATAAAPEPASLLLLPLGVAGLMGVRRFNRKSSAV